jgi:hypothetical protein
LAARGTAKENGKFEVRKESSVFPVPPPLVGKQNTKMSRDNKKRKEKAQHKKIETGKFPSI